MAENLVLFGLVGCFFEMRRCYFFNGYGRDYFNSCRDGLWQK
ncbi:hypothetical protein Bsph_2985 [Lysinibacillus sphaericus C3-41]|uniref:Uncharacterized protein n=1 Tax=Lysinibacillus sphaericus (strain C3-41) TaxID=444177 RepID=B1HNK4_LYSSC|nr:hypothetical protein Bsph_2985 [Lysinibacillus sphaericus C3-41]